MLVWMDLEMTGLDPDTEVIVDIAVIITDGNPTVYGQAAEGPGSFTRFREVENGVFSANALKERGTRILALGVGAGVERDLVVLGELAGDDRTGPAGGEVGEAAHTVHRFRSAPGRDQHLLEANKGVDE